ncbi:MAG: (deoxy)nucleoside triphosphate pyrophosphohydrolase [Treponema sp.]|nr:(deoxy)nucleoside triphosphate pyrophosphohydrolase [Treponema sp.]
MQTINVVAAIIIRTTPQGNRQVFATQRGYGDWKDWWEFPGGKIEAGESPEAALEREIREELATQIKVGERIGTIEYDYPAFHLSMQCFACQVVSGKLELLEHENAAWLTKETLLSVNWLPADVTILDSVAELL